MVEITIEEARKLYESNESIRTFLESKFSKDLLVESIDEKFNRVWNEEFLSKCHSVIFVDKDGNISKIPTSILVVLNSDDKWLFEYNYSDENKYVCFSYDRVGHILIKNVSNDLDILKSLIKKWAEETLNITNINNSSIKGL